jgi:toxin ParE1/3/4
MAFRISKLADEDITRIWFYGADIFGIAQAKKCNSDLNAVFELLSDNPRMGRERRDIGAGLRTRPPRSHIIIYTIDDSGVLIVRVRHAHEDWMQYLT